VLRFYDFLRAVTKTKNWERGTRNGERETGNREPGWESGNKCTAVTGLRIQNGGQRKRKGLKREQFGEI